jgi:hypothetical protein
MLNPFRTVKMTLVCKVLRTFPYFELQGQSGYSSHKKKVFISCRNRYS